MAVVYFFFNRLPLGHEHSRFYLRGGTSEHMKRLCRLWIVILFLYLLQDEEYSKSVRLR